MKQYTVTGMSCAACSARVEKAVSKVPGVTSCSVSLLTNSMGVEGTASDSAVIAAVTDAGYGAAVKGAPDAPKAAAANDEELLKDRETPVLKKRLIASVGFLLVLMYFSMGHMMWDWPLPSFFENNHVAMGLLQLLLTEIIMVINQKFFISGFKGLLHGAPNMDTLVALGSGASFVYSTYALFAMTDAQVKGDMAGVMSYMHEFYFESAAMILTLITVGKMLEARSKGKTTDALKGLMKLAPKKATVLRDGVETEVSIEQVRKGDIFVVRPGENIPVDGIVLEGSSAVNEAALTGESIPADKAAGDAVSAATINQSGFLKCEATRVGEDTTLSQIIQMVSDAAATKAPIAKVADKVSGVFVPAVIAIAIVTIIGWLLAGESVGFALARGISVLVISCPCALGLATPVAIMVGNGMGAKNGILFKTAVSLEETGRTEIVALDKTGTITRGEPQVTDLLPADGFTEEELLTLACALEQKSEHPLARAVLARGQKEGRALPEVSDFRALPGNGLTAVLAGSSLNGGNAQFISTKVQLPESIRAQGDRLAEEGKTPLYFAKDEKLAGIIAVADVIKEDSPQAISELQNMGIRVVMLTGDNERTARAIGRQAGVDEVIAGVLPDGKESVIRGLKKQGRVAMVGDGINDAPALTRADIGIAIGAGTDVAIDAADIVLMKSRLSDVPAAIRLSRATLRNIHQNLFWAFFYNAVGIPLAMGLWIPLTGWKLNPMFGAAAMSLSSFCVVTNALRLNLFKIYDAGRDKKIRKKKEKESKTMEKTMKIEGMMCGHCEARVKKVLEALPGVEQAVVSHQEGTAVVTLNAPVADELLKKTVEDQDYKVISIS
ncbi:copper-exporting ATPase [Marvinbryantia formatexigens DSM 14469]|uniref:P-type Cu(+) transporter n=1 Tax=Marvinbryantia formatexigens DSM 14469 TaxID=478749 RepID=C6LJQ3_9FIRM|nr:heavy metal translocating P-type ATPase [Marvinbryantia formatexigens]EET59176.1 copper-exporting ATPase [Marvinbryantia formatexigens DSM 14469]UWO26216.1 heavy metal translocating P-type ATPase [Marvinbryantia formatexigens DSM 14469]SDG12334.1 Cu2+-exporting ATPase [Marvinbryantia formatexigens]